MFIDLYGGHLIPGTLFFLLGIRWLLVTCYVHAKSTSSDWSASSDNSSSDFSDEDDDGGPREKQLKNRHRRRLNAAAAAEKKSSTAKRSWPNRSRPYRSTPTMPAPCLPCTQIRHEWTESYLKLLGSIIGIVFHAREGFLEYRAAVHDPIGYVTADTWPLIYRVKHHIIMYVAFFIGSIVELLIHCKLRLPARLDRALLLIEFGVEAFVFSNHFHGRNKVDEHFHVLLAMTILCCLLFCILECFNDRQVI